VVLGYGAHKDPAGVLAQGVASAHRAAQERGSELVAIASVTGTPDDPQGYHAQRATLEKEDIIVTETNSRAAMLAAAILKAAG
jgi:FdrA protein